MRPGRDMTLAARTMIALSTTLAHQLQRPRNVSVSVL